jgi:hypothetical protein
MKTSLMHYLYLISFIRQPLHALGVFIGHHQEVFTVYVQQLVCFIPSGDWQLVRSGCPSSGGIHGICTAVGMSYI